VSRIAALAGKQILPDPEFWPFPGAPLQIYSTGPLPKNSGQPSNRTFSGSRQTRRFEALLLIREGVELYDNTSVAAKIDPLL
jgi:hypothetical protein